MLTVHNADTTSIHKKIAFDFERQFIYYLNEKDSILETDSFEGDNIMVWLSVDPLAAEYPSLSPYGFVADNPIENKEVDGRYFVNANGRKVRFRKNSDGTLWISRNGRFNGRDKEGNKVKSDLGFLVGLVNESGSETAIDQVFETANNSTKIHVKTSKELNTEYYGLHQAHDKDGNILEWDKEKQDFNGRPAYVKGEEGVYKEATITIYTEAIRNGKYEEAWNKAWIEWDVALSEEQAIASVFAHETNHDTDKEYIKYLREKKEKPLNTLTPMDRHDNIIEKERKIWDEMNEKNKGK